jgi:hypothetical protein
MNWKTFPGEAAPPETKDCEWCDSKATSSHELWRNRKKMGTALFLYACDNHRHQAEEAAAGYKQPKTKEPERIKITGPGRS